MKYIEFNVRFERHSSSLPKANDSDPVPFGWPGVFLTRSIQVTVIAVDLERAIGIAREELKLGNDWWPVSGKIFR